MRHRQPRSELRCPGLQGDDRNVPLECDNRRVGKGCNVGDAFDVERDRRYARIFGKDRHVIGQAQAGLVAHADHMREGHRTQVHRHIEAYIPALRDNGSTALDPGQAVARRPERHAIQCIQDAIAVRANERDIPRRRRGIRRRCSSAPSLPSSANPAA